METVYERVVVDAAADANLGPIRARSPQTVAEMRRLRAAGAPVAAIAGAFGIGLRTAYRYLTADVDFVEVEAAGWRAWFAVSPGCQPTRVSKWAR